MRSELVGKLMIERNITLRKGMNLIGKIVAFIMCALLLCVSHAAAQVNTADVLGNVTDSTGGVVPAAKVTLTNTGTNISNATQTNAAGDYQFTLVQVGTYTVTVEANGFKKYSAPNISISAGDRTRVDAKMQVGDVTQTVEVQGTVAPALQTDSSAVSTLVTQQAVEDIPLNGRNVIKLIQLSPGTTAGPQNSIINGNRPDDRRQDSAFSVNGQGEAANNQMIDGVDNNERIIGGVGVRPSIDAIQEVNVNTNSYSAESGRTAGGVVNVITKSGTNNFHGSAYEFFRNKALNANPNHQFVTDKAGTLSGFQAKPAFRQNQYGGSIGGPIKKNKTFFFGDFEQFKQATGLVVPGLAVPTLCQRGTQLLTAEGYTGPTSGVGIGCPDNLVAGVPTIPLHQGDFSDSPSISQPGGSDVECDGQGGDPVYGSPQCPYVNLTSQFANFDHQGVEMFSLFPLPTPGAKNPQNNYLSSPTKTQHSTTFDMRFDHHFSDKNTFFGRYSFNDVTTVVPDGFPAVRIDPVSGLPVSTGGVLVHPAAPGSAGPQGPNGFAGTALERQQGLGLSFVHVFRPDLLLNLKAGYLRSSIRSLAINTGSGVSNKLGWPCNAVSCMNLPPTQAGSVQTSGLTGVNFDSGPGPGNGNSTPQYTDLGDVSAVPLLEFDNSFQYAGTLTWIKGNQSIKMGIGVIRRRASIDQSMAPTGEIFFDGIYTGEPGGDLLLGLARGGNDPQDGWRSVSLVDQGLRSWEPSAYIQDDWRARHWLTLNMGLRYDIFTPYTEVRGRISNFDQRLGLLVSPSFPGAQQTTATDGINTDMRNLAPRFGFAATLKHNTVVRGGFGISFFPTNYGSGASGKNPPYNYIAICQTQVNVPAGRQPTAPCVAPFASSAVANYGPPPSAADASFVGQKGGAQLSAGLPVPVVDFKTVIAPAGCNTSAALPTDDACTMALSASNPNGNPYVGVSLGNLTNFNFPSAYLEQGNLMVQKEIGSGNVITVGWVGEFGRHIGRSLNINGISNKDQTQLPLATQFPWLNSATIRVNMDAATSAYNALQATFVRRFTKGLTVSFNYTWAHALSNTGGACAPTLGNPCYYDSPSGALVKVPWFNKGYAWGNTGQDVADRFAWAFNYELPFGKSKTGIEGGFLKGWTVNSAGSWQSGQPVTVGTSRNVTGVSSGVPDQICNPNNFPGRTLFTWFNPACFTVQTAGRYGDERPGALKGPPTRNVDGSLNKEFTLTEKLRMQFRVEVFNLFNTPNFANPGRISPRFANSNAGTIGTAPSTPSISALSQTAFPREVQFGLKFLF